MTETLTVAEQFLADYRARLAAEAETALRRRAPQTTSYVIGLPVVVTVHPDGSVTAEVDLSEASDLRDASRPEDQADAFEQYDAALIAQAVQAHTVTVSA